MASAKFVRRTGEYVVEFRVRQRDESAVELCIIFAEVHYSRFTQVTSRKMARLFSSTHSDVTPCVPPKSPST